MLKGSSKEQPKSSCDSGGGNLADPPTRLWTSERKRTNSEPPRFFYALIKGLLVKWDPQPQTLVGFRVRGWRTYVLQYHHPQHATVGGPPHPVKGAIRNNQDYIRDLLYYQFGRLLILCTGVALLVLEGSRYQLD